MRGVSHESSTARALFVRRPMTSRGAECVDEGAAEMSGEEWPKEKISKLDAAYRQLCTAIGVDLPPIPWTPG